MAEQVEWLRCPLQDCELAAIVKEWFDLESTSGPVEHVRIECFAGHARILPAGTAEIFEVLE